MPETVCEILCFIWTAEQNPKIYSLLSYKAMKRCRFKNQHILGILAKKCDKNIYRWTLRFICCFSSLIYHLFSSIKITIKQLKMSKDNITNRKCKIIPTSYFSFSIFASLNCWFQLKADRKQIPHKSCVKTMKRLRETPVIRTCSVTQTQTLCWEFHVDIQLRLCALFSFYFAPSFFCSV